MFTALKRSPKLGIPILEIEHDQGEWTLFYCCQIQSTPKTIGILTKVFCTSGPNLLVLAWTGDQLSRGQAKNRVNCDFGVKFDLESQGQSLKKQ